MENSMDKGMEKSVGKGPETGAKLQRKLGQWATIGGSIGVVISSSVMFSLGNTTAITGSGVWLTAILALIPMFIAAFGFGELTAMFPSGGMTADYTIPALGNFWGLMAILCGYFFLCSVDGGLQQVLAAQTITNIFGGNYIVIAFVMVAILLFVNLLGVGIYGIVETAFTYTFMVLLITIGVTGLLGVPEAVGTGTLVNTLTPLRPENGWAASLTCAGAAVWWFIGIDYACPMAEESRNPHKFIPRGMIIALVLMAVAHVTVALSAVKYTDLTVLGESTMPIVVAVGNMYGKVGTYVMTAVVILAAITTGLAHMSAFPRMLYGLAHKGMVPKAFAYVHPKFRTPWVGLFFMTGMFAFSMILTIAMGTNAGVINMLINICGVGLMLSYAIVMIDVIVLRRRYPDYPRMFKVPGGIPTIVVGLIAIAYCIWTMRYILLPSVAVFGAIAIYGIIWFKVKGVPLVPYKCRCSYCKTVRRICTCFHIQ